MAWLIRIDGHEVNSDDMLLDDLAYVEKATGTYWSIANPWKAVEVAKAFVRVALVRSGIPEDDADERVRSLTLRDIKAAFDFVEDDASAEGNGGSPTGRTSRSSSPGARSGSGGRRKKPAGSG